MLVSNKFRFTLWIYHFLVPCYYSFMLCSLNLLPNNSGSWFLWLTNQQLFIIRKRIDIWCILFWKKISSLLMGIAQKLKFSIKDFFRKCDKIFSFLRIWSHLLYLLKVNIQDATLIFLYIQLGSGLSTQSNSYLR